MLNSESIAGTIFLIATLAVLGCWLGSKKIFGIRFGIAAVLFIALLFGHWGFCPEPHVLEFIREFGLILFVYTVGLQVAPGFFSSLRKDGLSLNMLALLNVILAGILVVLFQALLKLPAPVAVGIFSGATTNTPSLAAAQTMLRDLHIGENDVIGMPVLGYAVAYPFGVCGVILTMMFIRRIFHINIEDEINRLKRVLCVKDRPVDKKCIRVENPSVIGKSLKEIISKHEGVVISRIIRGSEVIPISDSSTLLIGDLIYVVGQRSVVQNLQKFLCGLIETEFHDEIQGLQTREILVTKRSIVGKCISDVIAELNEPIYVVHIQRGDLEFTPEPGVYLELGDVVKVIGPTASLDKLALSLGNSVKDLNQVEIVPFFIGIALGVFIGSYPIYIPGLSAPVKLGLAGGPLLVAILVGAIKRIGPFMWFVPTSANIMLRELGIILFLVAVGLRAGENFATSAFSKNGLLWLGMGGIITLVPIWVVSLVGRSFLKLNFVTLCGLLSGAMTDPPALAFAGTLTHSELPHVAYATVYPLTMITRIIMAQLLVLFLM